MGAPLCEARALSCMSAAVAAVAAMAVAAGEPDGAYISGEDGGWRVNAMPPHLEPPHGCTIDRLASITKEEVRARNLHASARWREY